MGTVLAKTQKAANIQHHFRDIDLRRATRGDITLVYQWQLQPETRRYAHSTRAPSFIEHSVWMRKQLVSNSHYVMMIESKLLHQLVGVVRLELDTVTHIRNEEAYVVSIFVGQAYWGMHIASLALQHLVARHGDKTMLAEVHLDNQASQRLFERSPFQRISPTEFVYRA
ncbi:GNAT family N-acetyltransferase [Vibrio maritimus]